MKEIRIPLPLVLIVLIALIAAAIGLQLPEIKRYLKVKSMD
jgi:Family of unknown function (DUF6893)